MPREMGYYTILAEKLEVQVMETRKKKLGVDHLDTLTSINNLAFTSKGQRRHPEAIKLMQGYVQLYERTLGVNHPHSLASVTGWMPDYCAARSQIDTRRIN
jgi:DNA-binding ferritin-like protein (Dps family)